jgi:hypothetical protein
MRCLISSFVDPDRWQARKLGPGKRITGHADINTGHRPVTGMQVTARWTGRPSTPGRDANTLMVILPRLTVECPRGGSRLGRATTISIKPC